MPSDMDELFVSLFLAVSLFIITLILRHYQTSQQIKKSRLSRAMRQGYCPTKLPVDPPSIVRERYAYLRKKFDHRSIVIFYIVALANIISSSGIRCSLKQFFLVNILLSIILAFVMHLVTGLRPLPAMMLSAPLLLLTSIHLLLHCRARRLERFRDIFPDALDLIVRSVRAGLPVSEAVKIIGSEISEPVGSTFREVAANLTIGMSLEESLSLLQKHVPIAEIKYFATSLTIQQETGGNLAEILANLAIIMRKRIQIRKKIYALSSEARASALIIGSLPFIVGLAIFVLNREYIQVLFVDEFGRLFLFGAMGSIAVGGMVMSKMIKFDI